MSSLMARLVFGLLPARTGDFEVVCVAAVPAATLPNFRIAKIDPAETLRAQ